MKWLSLALGVCVLTPAGCMSGLNGTKESIVRLPPPVAPPVVYPDQVNNSSAHEMAAALEAELNFEAHAEESKMK